MKFTVISEDVRDSINLALERNQNWIGKIEGSTFSLTTSETCNHHTGKPLVNIQQFIGERKICESCTVRQLEEVMWEIQCLIRKTQNSYKYHMYVFLRDLEEDGVDCAIGSLDEIVYDYLTNSDFEMDGRGKVLEYHPSKAQIAIWIIDKMTFKPVTISFMVINNATVMLFKKDGVVIDYFVIYEPAYYAHALVDDDDE